MSCATCDHEQSDCLSCSAQLGNKLLIEIYNDLQIVLKSIREKDYTAAEEVAGEITDRLGIMAKGETENGHRNIIKPNTG